MGRWGDVGYDAQGEREEELFELHNVAVMRETEKAILVQFDPHYGGDEHWIPKSQIHASSPVRGGIDVGTLVVSMWLAEKNEWTR